MPYVVRPAQLTETCPPTESASPLTKKLKQPSIRPPVIIRACPWPNTSRGGIAKLKHAPCHRAFIVRPAKRRVRTVKCAPSDRPRLDGRERWDWQPQIASSPLPYCYTSPAAQARY